MTGICSYYISCELALITYDSKEIEFDQNLSYLK